MSFSLKKGSILLGTMLFTTVMFIVGASVLDLARTNYLLLARNGDRARAQAVAESEMEYLFFQFKSLCLQGTGAGNVAGQLTALADNTTTPTTIRDPFLPAHKAAKWRVRRALITDRGTIQGALDGGTKYGQFTYVNARIEVLPPAGSRYGDSINVRVGRRFVNSSSTIFQYSIFYQGDLEITPGSNTSISGDIAVNGNVYLGITAGNTLTINNKLKYVSGKRFNKDANNATIYYNPDGEAPGVSLSAPTFATSESSQVAAMEKPENLLGGIDPYSTASVRPDLFGPFNAETPASWTEDQIFEAENNVYRSTIAPPPSAGSTGTAQSEYPNADSTTADDPAVAASRAYNRADIIVTVSTTGTVSVVNKKTGANITNTLTQGLSLLGIEIFPSTIDSSTFTMYDQREKANVKMIEIDVGALKTALEGANTPVADFNGLIYINQLGASSTTPAAVRLINAEKLPNVGSRGFSVATNGGLYIKGDYNTKTATSTSDHVPSMLMADALTVLSTSWNDANASSAITSRVATSGVTTVNAGLLAGTAITNSDYRSGGAQNMVRYLENWNGATVNFLGSIGRLFQSKHFDAPFYGPLLADGTTWIYKQPNRNFSYDKALGKTPPPGSPIITEYGRGNFFVW